MALDTFLEEYFSMQALADASPGIQRRYENLKMKGRLTKDQEKLSGTITPPNSADLDDLYDILLDAFRAIDDDKSILADNKDAKKFFEKNFGPIYDPGKKTGMFGAFVVNDTAMRLHVRTTENLYKYLVANEDRFAQMLSMNTAQYSAFLTDLSSPTKEFSPKKVRDQLTSILGQASQMAQEDRKNLSKIRELNAKGAARTPDENLVFSDLRDDMEHLCTGFGYPTPPGLIADPIDTVALGAVITAMGNRTSGIVRAARDAGNTLATDTYANNKAEFRTDYKDILEGIRTKKDIQKVILSKMDYDKANIIQKALGSSAFIENLTPLNSEKPNVFERAKKGIKNKTEDDYLGKLTSRHARHNYVMDKTANPIVEATLKGNSKIKPQDGLEGFLKNAEGIKGDLQNEAPAAVDHFNYLVKKLQTLKKSNPIDFKDALSDGEKLKNIVYHIAEDAAKTGKMDEAKTALETLAMLRYDSLTSNSFDKFKSNKLAPFAQTSMGKNANLKPIAWALDKTIDLTTNGLFMAGVYVNNKFIRGKGRKFGIAFEQVKAHKTARKEVQDYMRSGHDIDAAIAHFEGLVAPAKTAYENAYKSPNANEKEVEKLKEAWDNAELRVKSAKQIESGFEADSYNADPTNATEKPKQADDELSRQEELMMFWDFVNDETGYTKDRNILKSKRRSQAAANKPQNVFALDGATVVDTESAADAQFKKYMKNHFLGR